MLIHSSDFWLELGDFLVQADDGLEGIAASRLGAEEAAEIEKYRQALEKFVEVFDSSRVWEIQREIENS